jgi:hypothetical protein
MISVVRYYEPKKWKLPCIHLTFGGDFMPLVTALPFFSTFFLSPIFVYFAKKVNPWCLQLYLFVCLFLITQQICIHLACIYLFKKWSIMISVVRYYEPKKWKLLCTLDFWRGFYANGYSFTFFFHLFLSPIFFYFAKKVVVRDRRTCTPAPDMAFCVQGRRYHGGGMR